MAGFSNQLTKFLKSQHLVLTSQCKLAPSHHWIPHGVSTALLSTASLQFPHLGGGGIWDILTERQVGDCKTPVMGVVMGERGWAREIVQELKQKGKEW